MKVEVRVQCLPNCFFMRRSFAKIVLRNRSVLGVTSSSSSSFDKLHALLEAHCRRRDEAQRVIRAGGTGVGHLLFFADVTDDIFVFSAFAHDHALIYRHTRADEQPAALLCVKQAVSRGFPRLMHDDRARSRV